MSNIVIKTISQEDVAAIFKGNADAIYGIIEDSFKKYLEGDIIMPDKISQIFDEVSQNRINCMPATLIDEKICGMKWVSVFPSNAPKGVQNVTGIMLLSELKDRIPDCSHRWNSFNQNAYGSCWMHSGKVPCSVKGGDNRYHWCW